MPSKKAQFHLYLEAETYRRLMEIAPGYGAASALVRELIAKHLESIAMPGTIGRLVEKKYVDVDCEPKIELKFLGAHEVVDGKMIPIVSKEEA